MAAKPRRKSTLGNVYQNAAGAWLARYTRHGTVHRPGHIFGSFKLADDWLTAEQLLISRDEWTPPAERQAQAQAADTRDTTTLDAYARQWIDQRTTSRGTPLAPRTKREYRAYLDGRLSDLAAMPLAEIDRATVETWWLAHGDVPQLRHHCYALLKSVMADAVDRELIGSNPCKVANAARTTTQRPKAVQNDLITGLQPLDIAALAEATEPAQWRALVLLLAYTGLRPNEALALTRADLTRAQAADGTPRWTVQVTKALSTASGGGVKPRVPKTPESIRFVPIPPHVADVLARHIGRHAAPGDDGLLFPSTNPVNPWPTIRQVMGTSPTSRTDRKTKKPRTPTGFYAARIEIKRPELRLYDLRRWARHAWREAGIGDADCEQLLGHTLDAVMGAYVTLDRQRLWPYMDRLSEVAGWTDPSARAQGGPGIHPRLLAAMTGDQLATALAGMSDDQLAEVVPNLPTEAVARALTAGGMSADLGRELQG